MKIYIPLPGSEIRHSLSCASLCSCVPNEKRVESFYLNQGVAIRHVRPKWVIQQLLRLGGGGGGGGFGY